MQETPVGLVAIDLDGTLLRKDKTISAQNVRTLMEAQARGITVCINTGRMAQDAAELARQNGLVCAVAGNNGAHIMDAQGRTLYSGLIPGEKAVALCRMGLGSGMKLVAHFDGYVAVYPAQMRYAPVSRSASIGCRHGFEQMLRSAADGMRKLVVLGERHDPRLVQLRSQVNARFPELPVVSSGADNVEIGVEGSGKDAALRLLCGLYGVPVSHAMAIGDAENDLPMLRAAGWSTAMANASEAVKAVCRFVTLGNEEDGVAYAVRRWAMGEDGTQDE